jgi:hypothetical protein
LFREDEYLLTDVNDTTGRTQHEVDVVALARDPDGSCG